MLAPRTADTARDQLHLGALHGSDHLKQFQPVGDRPNRADQIVTNSRSDQLGQIDVW